MGDKEITFPAEIIKVQTMTDYSIRVTIDLPEMYIDQAAILMECKRDGAALLIMAKRISGNIFKPKKKDE